MTVLSPLHYVRTWGTSYLVLVIHASSLVPFRDLLVDFLALPALAGLAFGLFKYAMADFNRGQLELEVELLGEKLVETVFRYLLIVPLVVTCAVLLLAQLNGSYAYLAWWVVATGLITGGELGAFLKTLTEKTDPSP